MTAAKHNVVFEQGATFQRTINWKAPDGTPVDLTGYRIRMQVRQSPKATATLFDFDSANLADGHSIGALDETGVISLTVDASATLSLSFVAAEYDLTATSPDGFVYRLLEGKALASPGVTR